MPDRIDVRQADDLRDVIHQAVAALAQGGLVALATDSGYGLLASALHPAALDRLRAWSDRWGGAPVGGPTARPTLLLRAVEELGDWVDADAPVAHKLAGRVWPGPVIVRSAVRPDGLAAQLAEPVQAFLITTGNRIQLQIPADRTVRELVRLAAGPLVQWNGSSAWGAGRVRRPLTLAEVANAEGLSLILDSGDLPPGHLATVIGLDGARWSIIQPGAVSERNIAERAATIILFVCTGNTCRSPMAEALCKAVLARRLGCAAESLVDAGYLVLSAGVAASEGMPAATNAIEVVGGRGGSLVEHSSRQITPQLVRHADHILAMTWDHLDALLDQVPDVADRVRLLDPTGGDIHDPVGMDQATYQDTADEIERHLQRLLQDLGL